MTKSTKHKLEYQKRYNARPENVNKREKNNAARAELMREGKVHKGDGKDVAHRRALDNGGGNRRSNLEVQDRKENRGWRKSSGYRVPNSK